MGNLNDTLNAIDGATQTFFCGYDGVMIEKFESQKSVLDSDLFAANCVTVFKNLKMADNKFKEMICSFEKCLVVVRLLDDGFIGVTMGLDGNIGRAKLELNKYGSVFYK